MERYVPRMVDEVLESMIRDHPAIAVTGPRASGKTTTAARQAATTITLGLPPTASAFARLHRLTGHHIEHDVRFPLDIDELVTLAESRMLRPLTPAECRRFLDYADCTEEGLTGF